MSNDRSRLPPSFSTTVGTHAIGNLEYSLRPAYIGTAVRDTALMDCAATRSLFPLTKQFIYMNHAGAAPMSERARAAIEAVQAEVSHHPPPRAPPPAEAGRRRHTHAPLGGRATAAHAAAPG